MFFLGPSLLAGWKSQQRSDDDDDDGGGGGGGGGGGWVDWVAWVKVAG